MKLVLLADVKGQGKKGQLIDVSDGYARNYLLPRKLAVEAGNQVLSEMKSKEEARKHQEEVDLANAQKLKEKIESCQLVIKAAGGEGSKLYGAITSKDIAEKLMEQGIEVDKKKRGKFVRKATTAQRVVFGLLLAVQAIFSIFLINIE